MKGMLWCSLYIKEMTLKENYKVAYELWRERSPMTKKCGCKIIVKPVKLDFKSRKNINSWN